MDQARQIATLQSENASLRVQVASLEEKVLLLLQQQSGKAIRKESHNSHNPPSQDKEGKKSKSHRNTSAGFPPYNSTPCFIRFLMLSFNADGESTRTLSPYENRQASNS